MKKNLFYKSTIILLIGTFITRSFGFLIRVISTRIIGPDGINLYSLVMPTYSLFLAFSQLGLPIAISTVVARNNRRGKKIIMSIVPFILALNILMVGLIIVSSPYIAEVLLDNKNAKFPIMASAVVLPFVSISSILKGYFFGKQNMMPYAVSNVIEQIARLIIVIIFLPKLIAKGMIYGVCGFIMLSAISEIVSIIVFMFFLPKKIDFNKTDLKPDTTVTKEVLSLCIPTIGGRIIGNIAYFFEPIILTYTLKYVGYSNAFILSEYGTYNAYVLPLLMIPGFAIQAISTALVPEVSHSYELRDMSNIKKKLYLSFKICLFLGFITNLTVFIFPEFFLKLVYNTTSGTNYIRCLALFMCIFNLEGPISSALSAIGKPKAAFRGATIGVLVKTLALFVFSLFHIGLYGLIIGEILDILITVGLNLGSLQKSVKLFG